MPSSVYRLSPYCVVHVPPDGTGIRIAHGLYGSQFDLALALAPAIARLLEGASLDDALVDAPAHARPTLETLVEEKVLIDDAELNRLGGADAFRNRLGPIELAVQRGFNEGGYFPEDVDHAAPPPIARVMPDASHVALESHAPPPGCRDLVECLAARRSIRAYADRPMSRTAFEQFLELTARAWAVLSVPDLGQVSLRNYPSGGARYPLEIYPVAYDVEGLPPGAYHYQPFHHRLAMIPTAAAVRDGLRERVEFYMGTAAGAHGKPAVLLAISAVFARTCWKYRGIPYQLILQEVGALYQTMYLTATRLDLAPCAIGAFPELAINEILGLDGRDEAQVGLFVLGVPRPDDAAGTGHVIEGIRRLRGSPFSPDPDHASIELSFRGGLKEIVDVDALRVDRAPTGRLVCAVMRGRGRAEVDPAIEGQLASFLRP
jgi:SagB-type dehydrogenase family enzyme